MYGYQNYYPRYQVAPQAPRSRRAHHLSPVTFVPQPMAYQPQPISYQPAPVYYQPTQDYEYDDFDSYEEEPSELDLLQLEEERLLAEQRRILAQRRRVAEEKRRIQLERAQEQERARQQQAYQEALRRQRLAAQQQQQIELQRRRNALAAAREEAQLEAALRELDNPVDRYGIAYSGPYGPRKQEEKVERTVVDPVDFLLKQLFGAEAVKSGQQKKQLAQPQVPTVTTQSSPPRHVCRAQRRGFCQPESSIQCVPMVFSSPKPTSSAIPSSSKPVSKPASKPTTPNTTPKPASPTHASQKPTSTANQTTSALETLKQRVAAISQRVSELLQTSFTKLNNRVFGKVDSELMQILLALDNINTDNNEVARTQRKALVKETVSLIEKVDEFKNAFSSQSEASSHPALSDSETEEDTPVFVVDKAPAASSSASSTSAPSSSAPSLLPTTSDATPVLMEVDDLKSAAFPLHRSNSDVEEDEEIDADERASQESAGDNTEQSKQLVESQESESQQQHDRMDVDEPQEVQKDGENQESTDVDLERSSSPSLGHEDDPFGLKALATPSNTASPSISHQSPATKSTVVIEPVASASN